MSSVRPPLTFGPSLGLEAHGDGWQLGSLRLLPRGLRSALGSVAAVPLVQHGVVLVDVHLDLIPLGAILGPVQAQDVPLPLLEEGLRALLPDVSEAFHVPLGPYPREVQRRLLRPLLTLVPLQLVGRGPCGGGGPPACFRLDPLRCGQVVDLASPCPLLQEVCLLLIEGASACLLLSELRRLLLLVFPLASLKVFLLQPQGLLGSLEVLQLGQILRICLPLVGLALFPLLGLPFDSCRRLLSFIRLGCLCEAGVDLLDLVLELLVLVQELCAVLCLEDVLELLFELLELELAASVQLLQLLADFVEPLHDSVLAIADRREPALDGGEAAFDVLVGEGRLLLESPLLPSAPHSSSGALFSLDVGEVPGLLEDVPHVDLDGELEVSLALLHQHLRDDEVGLRDEVLGLLDEAQIEQVLAHDVQGDAVVCESLVVEFLLVQLLAGVASILQGLPPLDLEVPLDVLEGLLGVVNARAVVLHLLQDDGASEGGVRGLLVQGE